MPLRPAILLANLLLEHENLAATDLADHRRPDRDLREVVLRGADPVVPRDEKDVGERELFALRELLPGRLLDADDVARRNLHLLAAGPENRVHGASRRNGESYGLG